MVHSNCTLCRISHVLSRIERLKNACVTHPCFSHTFTQTCTLALTYTHTNARNKAQGDVKSQTLTRAHTHTYTHTRTHSRTHTYTRTHTHIHTHLLTSRSRRQPGVQSAPYPPSRSCYSMWSWQCSSNPAGACEACVLSDAGILITGLKSMHATTHIHIRYTHIRYTHIRSSMHPPGGSEGHPLSC